MHPVYMFPDSRSCNIVQCQSWGDTCALLLLLSSWGMSAAGRQWSNALSQWLHYVGLSHVHPPEQFKWCAVSSLAAAAPWPCMQGQWYLYKNSTYGLGLTGYKKIKPWLVLCAVRSQFCITSCSSCKAVNSWNGWQRQSCNQSFEECTIQKWCGLTICIKGTGLYFSFDKDETAPDSNGLSISIKNVELPLSCLWSQLLCTSKFADTHCFLVAMQGTKESIMVK